jgi:hypothetical protein
MLHRKIGHALGSLIPALALAGCASATRTPPPQTAPPVSPSAEPTATPAPIRFQSTGGVDLPDGAWARLGTGQFTGEVTGKTLVFTREELDRFNAARQAVGRPRKEQ